MPSLRKAMLYLWAVLASIPIIVLALNVENLAQSLGIDDVFSPLVVATKQAGEIPMPELVVQDFFAQIGWNWLAFFVGGSTSLLMLEVLSAFKQPINAWLAALVPDFKRHKPPELSADTLEFSQPIVDNPQSFRPWYQIEITAPRDLDGCSIFTYFDGIDPDGPGVQMHWQSFAGNEDRGVPTRKLRTNLPHPVPFIFRQAPNPQQASTEYPGAALLIDATFLNLATVSPQYFPAGGVKYVEFVVRSKGMEHRSGKIYMVSVPPHDADNSEFRVTRVAATP